MGSEIGLRMSRLRPHPPRKRRRLVLVDDAHDFNRTLRHPSIRVNRILEICSRGSSSFAISYAVDERD